MKLDINEIYHNYITRVIIFALFTYKAQVRQPNVYRQSVMAFVKKRIPWKINLDIQVEVRHNKDTERDLIIDNILNDSNTDTANLYITKSFDAITLQLKFTTPIKQNLLDYYLQDLSYQSYIIRTNENKYFVPKDSSYSTNNLYYITGDSGIFSNNLTLLNSSTYDQFILNFRRLVSIDYNSDTAEHTCIFQPSCYWKADGINQEKMNLHEALRIVNGNLVLQADDLTQDLLIGTKMHFYQSAYGKLIGNINTNQ